MLLRLKAFRLHIFGHECGGGFRRIAVAVTAPKTQLRHETVPIKPMSILGISDPDSSGSIPIQASLQIRGNCAVGGVHDGRFVKRNAHGWNRFQSASPGLFLNLS